MVNIKIAEQYTKTPGARYIKDGDFSGEDFRQKHLEEFFKDPQNSDHILVDLDGTEGYATSFLEEAFGGLARQFTAKKVQDRLSFKSDEDPSLIDEIKQYIADATNQ